MLRSLALLRHCRSASFDPRIGHPSLRLHRFARKMATPIQPLDFYDGPIVWIDCEMTGLNPRKDKILEIAVLITDGKLKIVDEGLEFVIKTEKSVLERMDSWCTRQHGNSGLTQACLKSPHTTEDVSKAVLAYIKKWIPKQRVGVLAGNSVHADRSFLVEEMPGVIDWLHYRIIDVSSVKEISRRWYPHLGLPRLSESSHRALDDIRGSIQELKWYQNNIFIAPPAPAQVASNARENSSTLPPLEDKTEV